MSRLGIDDVVNRVRDSRFGSQVLGPRVALPLAAWLRETFDEADSRDRCDPGAGAGDRADVDGGPGASNDQLVTQTLDAEVLDMAAATEIDDGDEAPRHGRRGLIAGLVALKNRITEHNLVVVAAGIAFWALLAIPAVLFATVSIAGLVLDPTTVKDQVNTNLAGLPDDARSIVGDQLAAVSGSSTGGLVTGVVLSLLLALWSSSGAMAKMMATLNTINGVGEDRSFLKLRGLALAMTFGGIVFVTGAIFLLAALPPLLESIDAVGESLVTLFNSLRFVMLALVMVVALGVLYHIGPAHPPGRYRVLSLGAFVATVLWVALSALFSVYTATLGSYNETYGSLGGLVVLLLWLFITAFVVLIGAEIYALRSGPR